VPHQGTHSGRQVRVPPPLWRHQGVHGHIALAQDHSDLHRPHMPYVSLPSNHTLAHFAKFHRVPTVQVDITVNNHLAVTNTKLLADYAAIDGRLAQLVFVIKAWAKVERLTSIHFQNPARWQMQCI
jgi:hypothetical protein